MAEQGAGDQLSRAREALAAERMAAKARSGRPGGRQSAASGGQAARNRPLRDSVESIAGELAGA
ncbi:MAG: hypothetical protein J2P29_09745, partial [Actinobacteria bacterium]|nr:hypothetical protein [Actinomycetota bacterium]